MYTRHFGLKRQPFSIAPNPRFLYMSRQHREALAHLMYVVRTNDGFAQLTGEVGTGKTTICRCLVERLPQEVDVALILNPRVTPLELVASLCDELKIAYPKDTTSIKVLTDVLNAFLLENHAAGRHTVLVIDEAQCLSAEALEQVRLLTNLETSTAKLLQIILVGQPELRELLARDDLRQLAQRITARFHLMPMSRAETAAYIRHRLQLAGARGAVFDERAIDMVHQLAKGVPRLINVLCDRAMLGAFARGVTVVDTAIMRKAAAEVLPAEPPHGTRPWALRRGLAAALLLCLGLAAGLWYSVSLQEDPSGGVPPVSATAPPLPPSPPPPQEGPAPLPDTPDVTAAVAPGGPAMQQAAQPTASEPISPEPVPSEPMPSESLASADAAAQIVPEPAVADEPSPAEPPPAAPSLTEQLEAAGTAAAARAWAGLYRLWGYDSAAATDEQACAQAPTAGLSCLMGAGSWGMLRRFDRPAVLLLQAGGARPVAVVLQRIAGDQVALEVDGEVLQVPRAEVERSWFGAYRLLWKKPPAGNVVLRLGMRGKDVRWLRERLARATGREAAAADPALYDDALASQVKALQREHGLLADGIAGAHTLIVLNNLVADPEIPHLVGAATASSE
jgi:general secretion pathway protein A